MLSPRGNPNASNLFAVLGYLQSKEGIHFVADSSPTSPLGR